MRSAVASATMLVDLVFPVDTNHHGTLFGGVALAHMDKVAFIAASRHGRVDFVTASCQHTDFIAPGQLGEIAELKGEIVRVGRRSLGVQADLHAENPISGERRHCGRSQFHMGAIGKLPGSGDALPPLPPKPASRVGDTSLRMIEMDFPEQTSHYGSLFGGHAIASMAKAAFVAASRGARAAVVLTGSPRIDFRSRIRSGEIMEIGAEVARVGRTSMGVDVTLAGENRFTGEATFAMVAIDTDHRPIPVEDRRP